MPQLVRNRIVTLVLLLFTVAAGYLGFRYFYGISADFPFSQELLLVFIGAIATVLITALLLNQQTDLELRKEGEVLLLGHKAGVYTSMIEHLGAVVELGRLEQEQVAELRVLNHKLAMVGSVAVIRSFSDVLARLDEAVRDQIMEPAEKDAIMAAVAILTFHMRRDLLGRIADDDAAGVLAAIKANTADLEHS